MTSIGDSAFEGCSGLTSIEIPSSVTSIGEYAFCRCSSLESVTIPESVTLIGVGAFYGCNSLKKIEVDSRNTVYYGEGNCLITKADNILVKGCCESTIPFGVTSIGGSAFEGYSGLTSIEIPSSVTSIGNCAFKNCSSLVSITIPEGVTSIGIQAFYNCRSLESITIPSGVASIKESTFLGCRSLKSIAIPESVTSIGNYAFAICPSTLVISAEPGSYAEQWAKDNGYQLAGQTSTENPVIPEQPVTDPSIPGQTASQQTQVALPATKGTILTSLDAKCKVKVVSDDAANPTVTYIATTETKAASITIPDTVKVRDITYKVVSVSSKAFKNNKKVKNVIIGKNVTSIGKSAFENCTKLTTVTVNSTTLNMIGSDTFKGDKKLTKITLKTSKLTKSSVGKNALKGTGTKLVIKVPKKKVSKYKTYFKNKGNKTVKVTKK